ncbi:MAG: hypothetical protein Q4F60_03660 [Candidatus Saccharibacteria bacterium]|nr:hypothetical protein [Candidatus Saccharibacteria bacterium]
MVKQSKGTTAIRVKAGGKKAVEAPVQGSPTWNLLGAMAIATAAILVFGIGYLIGGNAFKNSGGVVVNVSEELARVTVAGDKDGEWEFAVADGKVVEYAGRDDKAVYMTGDDEKKVENAGNEQTVSADATANLSDDDYKNASDESSSAEGYRRTYYFRGLNKGETTVTMNYRKNGAIEKTKAYVVSVDDDLKATVKE